ncbi:MAG TPA: glycosyltransferase [Tepidisphaeraceae bacterium]|nr:glycosyltransferase [Tepidisphaeraceae bacterium]
MRVVYANAQLETHNTAEGGQAHMRQFIENAAALGHELFVWHGDQHPLTKPVPSGKLKRFQFFRTVDVVYYRIEWRPPKGSKIILPPYRKIIGNPLVVWEFNTVPEYGRVQNVPEWVIEEGISEMRRLGQGVDLAFCVSNAIRGYVQDKLGFRRVLTIPNGSDPNLFRPDVPPVPRIVPAEGRLNVVWIGSANLGWHNFDLLKAAAKLLWDTGQGDRIVFHVIGPGMQGMRDAPPNLNYYGAEKYDQLPGWLSAMDVGLNVYKPGAADYSSPLKVFDYMASGLTVVSTEQPQVREIFTELNQTDLLVPPDKPEALAEALVKLASDPQRRHRQGTAGRQLVIDRYNWKTSVTTAFSEMGKLFNVR